MMSDMQCCFCQQSIHNHANDCPWIQSIKLQVAQQEKPNRDLQIFPIMRPVKGPQYYTIHARREGPRDHVCIECTFTYPECGHKYDSQYSYTHAQILI